MKYQNKDPKTCSVALLHSQSTLSRQIMKNWKFWKTSIEQSNYHRRLEQLAFRTQHSVQDPSPQDLHPRPCPDPRNDGHWTRRTYYSYVYLETDGFSHISNVVQMMIVSLWETWFCSNLSVPTRTYVNRLRHNAIEWTKILDKWADI